MDDPTDIRARLTMLTIAIQALYLAYPNGEAALRQLQRLAVGSRDMYQGMPIDEDALDRLQELLDDLINAIAGQLPAGQQ